jgi:hypothetical protein
MINAYIEYAQKKHEANIDIELAHISKEEVVKTSPTLFSFDFFNLITCYKHTEAHISKNILGSLALTRQMPFCLISAY